MNIEGLRNICMSMRGATEDIKWGTDLVFSIGGKMFCVTSMEPPLQFSFKVKEDEFEELSSQPGFIPAPYMARAKWVMVTEPERLSKKMLQDYIGNSYEMVKSKLIKKQRTELGV